MGGRGAYSMSGRSVTSPGMHNVGGASDRRGDVQELFGRAGFVDVTGTNGIDVAVLGAYAITLADLERQYGAIGASDAPVFTTGNGAAKAAVFYYDDRPADQFMAINSDLMGTIKVNVAGQRDSERDKWHAPTDGRITKLAGYTVTHEYGHMLSNALAAKNGMTASSFSDVAAKEIRAIAKTRYGARPRSQVSKYGAKDNAEFFAESFASLHSGKPNAFGMAMGDWLRDNTL